MSSIKYYYSKIIDVPRLTQEIRNESIIIALDYINSTEQGDTDIYFKSNLSSSDSVILNGIVDSHINSPLPENTIESIIISGNRDDFGNIIFTPALDDSMGFTPKKKMYKHSVVAGQTNIFDVQVTTERRINGGEYWVSEGYTSNVHVDDYVEFSIVDKDDILGLFNYYGLIQGSDILELSKFVITDYVQKGNPITGYHAQCFEGITGTSKVYQGLYYRIIYESCGNDDLNFLDRIYYYE